METWRLHKKWIVWLLPLMLAWPFAARSIHISQCRHLRGNDAETAGKPFHHHSETCPVCQFVLSPFVETEPDEFDFTVCLPSPEPVIYQKTITLSALYSYCLRAPPRKVISG
ncbi:MAG: hypothetical protein LBL42_07560 [Tannerella sp.]|jgi:hypothetical protein|nr:hypothetical protein [Tannerella sp.]